MKKIVNYIFSFPEIPSYAKMNFQLFHIESDRVMLRLLVLQWAIATFVTSIKYSTYYYGFFSGALIVLPLVLLYKHLKGERYFRYFIAVAMMLFSVIFIQQYLGRIEMHFHVFIAMAILTLYKDVMPLVFAAATTIIHHIVFNYLQLYEVSLFDMPVMVFNYGCGFDIVILHAIFVIIELFVLGYIVRLQIEHTININESQNRVNELNRELAHLSMHDMLTDLPNRLNLNEKIQNILIDAEKNAKKFAVIFLDLDHFKNINDTLGHDIGDALLKRVAALLKESVSKDTLIARIGGDEFIMVASDFNDQNELVPTINNLLNNFRKDLLIKGYLLRLSASIGISIYPDDAQNVKDLMKYADIAMYKAKGDGRDNFSFFSQELNTKVHTEVDIVNDMQRAFAENEFQLYYQPKVDALNGKIIGAEALLRWQHKQKGFIPPSLFIPLAENTGFILNLGKFVIQSSTQAIKRFSSLGFKDLSISINVSTRQFQNSNLYQDLKENIEYNRIDPTQLGIEITEGVILKYVENTLSALREIKKLGVSVYVDDFGTGYSSLSYLKKFPIDTLKIDKSFVDDIVDNENGKSLVNTILSMGKSLHLKTVAEGVETKEQYEFLRDNGCDAIQGYYFAKPMCEDEFIALLEKDKMYS
ncbi:MAG: EAL domain-containing protein [Sulfurimonas sp.]|uniref:putative bifunctional diguanylate cyclase/phosphodiesterase n=1 Tax=Sulfurimonas sp. TaxID=2022749 RepID=UPI0026220BF6|nr:EAL domain-containing protein [Sulfurimonas sp.]MDD2653361.1 EAL domain-containing protein [Sulfurimonas sp.]MDD3450667.1 EAL domain-containing protein [Sulfurimonas sp.]